MKKEVGGKIIIDFYDNKGNKNTVISLYQI